MTPRSYLRIFKERWRVVVVITLIALAVAAVVTGLSTKKYQADVQVFVSSNTDASKVINSQYDENQAAQAQVATFAALIDTPDVLKAVRSDLNLDLTEGQIAGRLSATAPATQTFVEIHVVDSDPDLAAAIANSAAQAFIKAIEKYKTPSDSRRSSVRLFVTDPAAAPTEPVSPKPVLNISLGFLVGLLVGLAVAVTRDFLDNRIKEVEDLERVTGKPVMGVIVDDGKAGRQPIAAGAARYSQRAENFRQLRANLQFANVDAHPRVIAVTSSIPTEGKTMVATNLAASLAEAGFTACLVDTDLRRPTVAKNLELPGSVGLTSVLIQQIDVGEALQRVGSNLWVLCSGPIPPNPAEVLASIYVRDVIRSMLERFDYVVVDTAPILPVADGAEVASLADATLFVTRHKLTTETQVKRSIAALARVGAPVVGLVLNRAPKRRGRYGNPYYQYRDEPTMRSVRPSPGSTSEESGSHAQRTDSSTASR